jgi:hypothetical protein
LNTGSEGEGTIKLEQRGKWIEKRKREDIDYRVVASENVKGK